MLGGQLGIRLDMIDILRGNLTLGLLPLVRFFSQFLSLFQFFQSLVIRAVRKILFLFFFNRLHQYIAGLDTSHGFSESHLGTEFALRLWFVQRNF